MTANSYHLPSAIYKYLSLNENRPVPFQELCLFLYTLGSEAAFSFEVFSAEKAYQTRVMDILIFLSDINLITLDQATDESVINKICRN
ncbi:hypothetical protein [Flavobacterium foetidum]|uniref:hypothetical protein n=1 Tax=Flavobacterium foetidum TaxID=2026681 RepID=UPI001074AD9F|nr:hypothetical protein [Flavobacterium foetidum]KAF2516668.1 hypothetical protein E0W73_06150 [Flavobacterium foetidum]